MEVKFKEGRKTIKKSKHQVRERIKKRNKADLDVTPDVKCVVFTSGGQRRLV